MAQCNAIYYYHQQQQWKQQPPPHTFIYLVFEWWTVSIVFRCAIVLVFVFVLVLVCLPVIQSTSQSVACFLFFCSCVRECDVFLSLLFIYSALMYSVHHKIIYSTQTHTRTPSRLRSSRSHYSRPNEGKKEHFCIGIEVSTQVDAVEYRTYVISFVHLLAVKACEKSAGQYLFIYILCVFRW